MTITGLAKNAMYLEKHSTNHRRKNKMNPTQQEQKKIVLAADLICKYLTTEDEKLDTAIICNGSKLNMLTTDQILYEAIASADKKKININKLVKLLEITKIISHENVTGKKREILTPERADKINNSAKSIKIK